MSGSGFGLGFRHCSNSGFKFRTTAPLTVLLLRFARWKYFRDSSWNLTIILALNCQTIFTRTFALRYSWLSLLSVHQNTLWDRLVCPSVRLSVRFHDNSWKSRRRLKKLSTIILEVKSNIEFEDGSRTWPLTRSNWGCILVNTCIYVLLQFICIPYRQSWANSFILGHQFLLL